MFTVCESCEGKGYFLLKGLVNSNIKIDCSACNGKGGFGIPDRKSICPECNGTGQGYVVVIDIDTTYECPCDTCSGTGLVDTTK